VRIFNLEDINLADYEPRTRSMQAILGIDGANKRQVLKQPDVLMLLYLMRQSHDFPYNEEVRRTGTTTHRAAYLGSSLGPAIHAILASDLDKTAEATMVYASGIGGSGGCSMLLMGFTELLPVECGRQWFWDSAGSTDTKGPVANPLCPNWTRLSTRFTGVAIGMSSICALVPTSGASSLTWMVSDGYGRITLSSLAEDGGLAL